MKLTQHELDLAMERRGVPDDMNTQQKKDWLQTKMQTFYDLREEGFSYDDIARRYPSVSSQTIRVEFKKWLDRTGKKDPRER